MFDLKRQSKSGTALYTISKLLLNGLYGRFGMDPNLSVNKILTNSESRSYLSKSDVENITPIHGTDYVILSYKTPINVDRPYVKSSVSIALSASITAEARIIMNIFKNKYNYNIYYTDTDSLFLSVPLEKEENRRWFSTRWDKVRGIYKKGVFEIGLFEKPIYTNNKL